MARRSKWEKFKPEVFRMLSEGFTPSQILANFEQSGNTLPTSTVYDWAKEYRLSGGVNQESGNDSGEMVPARLPIDPESPIENIIQKLWDLYDQADDLPPAKSAAKTRILEAILKAHQVQYQHATAAIETSEDMPDVHVEIAHAETETH